MRKQIIKRQYSNHGYSLIEIAVVIAIVGVLMSLATMNAPYLLDKVRLSKTISQVRVYQTAVALFQNQYGALPGDYAYATTSINAGLVDGNGDGVVSTDDYSLTGEQAQFWQHLAAAGLIKDIEVFNADGDTASYDELFPRSGIGGYFTVEDEYLLLSAADNSGVATPAQAAALREEFGHNEVVIGNGANATEDHMCIRDGVLAREVNSKVCVVRFNFYAN